MKILAIRGENLASLTGKFEVDLETGPLGPAGLFTITGPTGSGKSTLLDAACLALYSRMPRLVGPHVKSRIGDAETPREEREQASDVRNIMQKGTGRCFAEVEFIGLQGRRYRATWRAWRAHKRPDGAYQPLAMATECLDSGELVSGNKTDVLKANRQFVGLTFEQFTRSAMLAQGDFAAFLKAGGNDRAVLLERMTGCDIYTRISKAAFERAKQEREARKDLLDEREALGLLEPEARAELEALVKQLAREHGEAKQHAEQLKGALGLHEKVEEATARLAAGLERREMLQERLELATTALAEHEKHLSEATAAEKAARHKQAEAKPELDRAKALDVKVDAAGKLLKEQAAVVRELVGQVEVTDKELKTINDTVDALHQQIHAGTTWLEEQKDLAPLERSWERASKDLETCGAVHEELAARRADEQLLARRIDAAVVAMKKQEQARDAAEERLVVATEELLAAEQAVAATSREELTGERQAAQAEQTGIEAARAAAVAATESEAQRLENLRAVDEEHKAAETHKAAVAHNEAELKRLEGSIEEAETASRLARDAAALEERRALLVEGEACPLCGATEHPWSDGSPVAALADEHERRVKALRQRQTEARDGLATAREKGGQAEKAARLAAAEAEARAAEVEELRSAWAEARAGLAKRAGSELPEDVLAAEAVAQSQARLDEVIVRLAELDGRERALNKLDQRARKARSAEKKVRAALDRARQQVEAAAKGHREAEQEHSSVVADIGTLEVRQADAVAGLKPLLQFREGWQQELLLDPRAFSAVLGEAVIGFRQQAEELKQHEAELAKLLPRVAEVKRDRENLSRQRDQAIEKAATLEAGHEELGKERKTLFGGRETKAVEAGLQGNLDEAGKAVETARSARDEATAEHKRAEGELDCAGVELAKQEAEKKSAEANREARLKELELPADKAGLEDLVAESAQALEAKDEELRNQRVALATDDEKVKKAAAIDIELEAGQAELQVWEQMDKLIGASDGARFRRFAQGLTLDVLLSLANAELASIAPRYRIERVPGSDLNLQMVDQDMGDEIRSTASLSGGETFLVSLALALGLAQLSATNVAVESLFIDEGFGALDPEALGLALDALENLHATGRKVGVISHVDELANHIEARVVVKRISAGRSRVVVEGL